MGGSADSETDKNIAKLREYQQRNNSQQQLSQMYSNQMLNSNIGERSQNNPWAVRTEAGNQNISENAATVAVQGIRNDFIIDKSSIKWIEHSGEVKLLSFKFESKAPNCQVTLYQKVKEAAEYDQTRKQAVAIGFCDDDPSQTVNPQVMYFQTGKHEFQAQVGFFNFHQGKSQCHKKKGYYPLVAEVICNDPADPTYRYSCMVYLEFDISTALIRLIQQKIITSMGVHVMEEAFGLNSSRNDGDGSTRECVICLGEDKNTLAKPCKHVSMCYGCAQVLMTQNRQCPICRQTIVEIIPLDIQATAQATPSIQ